MLAVVPEIGPTESLGEYVGVLLSRSYVLRAFKSSRSKWKRTSICLLLAELRRFSIISSVFVPWLSSRASILAPHVSGAMKDKTARTNKAYLALSPADRYSASEVDNETARCFLLAWFTTAPPKVTAIPDTERLSLSLFA